MAGSPHLPVVRGSGEAHVIRLRYGTLHASAAELLDTLEAATREAFPDAGIRISGQSGLRFLLDRDRSTWAAAAERCGLARDGDPRVLERDVVTHSTTLADPGSWVEELTWTNGPSVVTVDHVLGSRLKVIWDEDPVLGHPRAAQRSVAHPAHWSGRLYSAAAFALYAAWHHHEGRELLGPLLGPAPHLPQPQDGAVSFPAAHRWLPRADLTWLRPGHHAHDLLAVLLRLVPDTRFGVADPADLHAATDAGLLRAAAGIRTPGR